MKHLSLTLFVISTSAGLYAMERTPSKSSLIAAGIENKDAQASWLRSLVTRENVGIVGGTLVGANLLKTKDNKPAQLFGGVMLSASTFVFLMKFPAVSDVVTPIVKQYLPASK